MAPLTQKHINDIRLVHARQLAKLNILPAKDTAPADDSSPTPEELQGIVLGWIAANPAAIKAAKEAQCASASRDSPNWDVVFFALAESIIMYMRKSSEIAKAALAAREGDHDRAVAHIQASQELIDPVAKALGCTFVQLCDFAEQNPEGGLLGSASGTYAGLFVSNDSGKPFMGVGFKGSSSYHDGFTNLDWCPIVPLQPDIAWGAPTHRGFYLALFGQFAAGDGTFQVPFDVLVEQLSSVYHSDSKLHFTGHSLGGGLCTLAYGEFLRRQSEAAFAKYLFGDLYALAAPRTSLLPFADKVNELCQAGGGRYTFRIVNKEDPVTTIPPPLASELVQYPFVHVGGGWKMTDNGPEKLADEPPPVPPAPISDMVFEDHDPRGYYASWQKTPHS
ncbi:Alpha/Beta hydrolase protein [Trametes meyenii]|nr:Alpha/Beta hydrolase protein [Trametes meyenii]